MREFAGLSYEELAAALGVTGPAVESLLVRARTKLRLALVHANPMFVPLVIRDQVARFTTGFHDGSATGVAKLVSIPVAAKLAAAGAGVAIFAAGGPLSHRSVADRLAPVRVPVPAATFDRRVASTHTGHGSSVLSSTTRKFAVAVEREYGDRGGGGVGVRASVHGVSVAAARLSENDDSSSGSVYRSGVSGALRFDSSRSSPRDDEAAPLGNLPQIGAAAGGDGGGATGASAVPAAARSSATSGEGKEKEDSSAPTSGTWGGAPKTSPASSDSEPTESEDHSASNTPSSDWGESSDDDHSSEEHASSR